MTDNTQPEAGSTHIIRFALELGLLWIDGSGRDKVREALDALDTLEAQLEAIGAGGVSGPLMGRASISANAGEPTEDVKQKIASNTWDHFGDILPTLKAISRGDWCWGANTRCKYIEIRIDTRDGGCILYDSKRVRISPEQFAHQHYRVRMEPWPASNSLAAPPTAQAGGWRLIETAPKGELVLLWSEIKRGEPFVGDWAEYARYNQPQFTHWSRWAGLPPTSAEGVDHG